MTFLREKTGSRKSEVICRKLAFLQMTQLELEAQYADSSHSAHVTQERTSATEWKTVSCEFSPMVPISGFSVKRSREIVLLYHDP